MPDIVPGVFQNRTKAPKTIVFSHGATEDTEKILSFFSEYPVSSVVLCEDMSEHEKHGLQNKNQKSILPAPQFRFVRLSPPGALKRDHAPVELRAVFYDYNGHLGFNPAQVQVTLRLWNSTTRLPLRTNSDVCVGTQGIIYVYGVLGRAL